MPLLKNNKANNMLKIELIIELQIDKNIIKV